MKNFYSVEAHFERHRLYHKIEIWQGPARNLVVAVRRAVKDIMQRRGVKRLRHARVTYHVERIVPEQAQIKASKKSS